MTRARPFLRAGVLALLASAGVGSAQAPHPTVQPQPFGDFSQRLEEYLKLRKGLPDERTTKHRKEIVDRRRALATAIREARKDAKQGDIFTPEISAEFNAAIRETFQGSKAVNVRKTIRQGEPLAPVRLSVNGSYPEHLPVTTVPPTLLRRLPQLPERLAYRIVAHDFVLQDTEARLVIDFIPGALP